MRSFTVASDAGVPAVCRAAQPKGSHATVLSIGKLTVEQSRYYERQVAQGRDDYYSGRGESPGRWTGAGAETLRLGGRVDDDGFRALMDGRDPGTGERLKRVGGRSKVAAFDLTFSAPKSVSVLFAIGEPALAGALVEAHESAVDAALGYLEREACRVRRGRGGVRRELGEGFVAAAYRHRMSRAEDPQLHTHVVAANMARGADGRWTALDATPIYRHAKAAGFLYQAHLRAAVRERLAVGALGAGAQRDGRDRAARSGGVAGVLHASSSDRGARARAGGGRRRGRGWGA